MRIHLAGWQNYARAREPCPRSERMLAASIISSPSAIRGRAAVSRGVSMHMRMHRPGGGLGARYIEASRGTAMKPLQTTE